MPRDPSDQRQVKHHTKPPPRRSDSCRFKHGAVIYQSARRNSSMSLSATYVDRASAPQADPRTLLFVIWIATVLTYLATSSGLGENLSTDDAMRLVEVRDLLAGQS